MLACKDLYQPFPGPGTLWRRTRLPAVRSVTLEVRSSRAVCFGGGERVRENGVREDGRGADAPALRPGGGGWGPAVCLAVGLVAGGGAEGTDDPPGSLFGVESGAHS